MTNQTPKTPTEILQDIETWKTKYNAPFARVYAREDVKRHNQNLLRSLVLLDNGTKVAMSENVRFDALNIEADGSVNRINVYLDQIFSVIGFATIEDVTELFKIAR